MVAVSARLWVFILSVLGHAGHQRMWKINTICHLVGACWLHLGVGSWKVRGDKDELFLIFEPWAHLSNRNAATPSVLSSWFALEIKGSRNPEGLLSNFGPAVTYSVSLGMPLCASLSLSVNEMVGLGGEILEGTFLTPV